MSHYIRHFPRIITLSTRSKYKTLLIITTRTTRSKYKTLLIIITHTTRSKTLLISVKGIPGRRWSKEYVPPRYSTGYRTNRSGVKAWRGN